MLQRYKLLPENRKRLQFLQALARLKQNNDFQLLIDVLNQAQTNIDCSNRKAVAPEIQWNQGAAQFLDELLDTVGTAEQQGRDLRDQIERTETPQVTGF